MISVAANPIGLLGEAFGVLRRSLSFDLPFNRSQEQPRSERLQVKAEAPPQHSKAASPQGKGFGLAAPALRDPFVPFVSPWLRPGRVRNYKTATPNPEGHNAR